MKPHNPIDTATLYWKNKAKSVTVHEILEDVCKALGEKIEEVASKCRKKELARCRFIYCYVCSMIGVGTLKEIGNIIGGRDHGTIINARDTVKDYLETKDPAFLPHWERYLEKTKIYIHEGDEYRKPPAIRVEIKPEEPFVRIKGLVSNREKTIDRILNTKL